MFKLLLAIVVGSTVLAGASSSSSHQQQLRRAQDVGGWLFIGGAAMGQNICQKDVCYDYYYGDIIIYQPDPPKHYCAEFTYDLEYYAMDKKEDGLTHTAKVVLTTGCVPYDGRPDGCVAFLDDEQCDECSLCRDDSTGIQVNCSNVAGGIDLSERCQHKWRTSSSKVLKLF